MAKKKRESASRRDSGSAGSATKGSSDDLITLKQLGRYEIQKKLGSGGMGAVYLARDTNLNRMVAVKVLPPEKAENETLVKRFKAEAQAAAQLTHDNIVRVFESGEADGYHYIAMEYVEGTDVQRLIKKRSRIPIRRSTEIIKQVAEALDHASAASIVHRDIKPSNLLITQEGVVKLTDLGLARVVDDTEETSITRAGTTVGTVDYMAPEQARSSKAADIRSDLYSLGCTWYHMLTGSPPFPEGSVTNKLHAHAVKPIPDPRSINDQVPEAIVGVLQRLMAKKPVDRYQTPAELLEDLEAAKSRRREVRSEDLAALASADADEIVEDEEEFEARSTPMAIPARERSRVQEDEEPRSSRRTKRREKQARSHGRSSNSKNNNSNSSGVEALPPREKRKLEDVEGKDPSSFNLEWLKYGLIACGLIAAVGLVGYVVASVASSLSAPADDKENIDLARTAEEIQEAREAEAENQNQGGDDQNTNGEETPVKIQKETEKGDGSRDQVAKNGRIDATQAFSPKIIESLPIVQIVDADVETSARSAHSLRDALEKTDDENLVIELATTRSLRWEQPIGVEDRNVIIRPAEGTKGNILVDSAAALANGLIQARNAQVVLESLHFGLLGHELPGEKELTLLRMVDSDLQVQGCSFTLAESRAGPVQLCRFQTSSSRKRSLLWRKNLVRGNEWKTFELGASQLDFLAEDSLFLIGGEPFLNITPGINSSSITPVSATMPERDIALSDVLTICDGTPFLLSNTGDRSNATQTQFRLNRTHFVARSLQEKRPFFAIANWPENLLNRDSGGKLSGVNWISEDASFSGWTTRLLATNNKTRARYEVQSNREWQTFWGNSGLLSSWDSKTLTLPASYKPATLSGKEIAQLGVIAVARLDKETEQELQQLPSPNLPHGSWRGELFALQPKPQPVNEPFNDKTERVSIDLSDAKADLGRLLASRDLPNPVIVEVKGFGIRTVGPVRVSSRQVKLIFQSEPGKFPLTLRPEKIPAKAMSPWFEVNNGFLVIEKGVFRVDPPSRQPLPTHWIRANNSHLVIRDSHVTAAPEKQEQLQALVTSRRDQNIAADKRSLLVEHSFLQYGGNLIDADLASTQLFVKTSALVSLNNLLRLSYSDKPERQSSGFFRIERSTLSSLQGFLHFEVPSPGEHQQPLITSQVDETVFAPPIQLGRKSTARPLLISATCPLEELPSRVSWWGNRNGYAPVVQKRMFDKPLAEVWENYWGPGHVMHPLFGAEGVMLSEPNPKGDEIRPSMLTLFKECEATKWAADETSIGAPCEELEIEAQIGGTNEPGQNTPEKKRTTTPQI